MTEIVERPYLSDAFRNPKDPLYNPYPLVETPAFELRDVEDYHRKLKRLQSTGLVRAWYGLKEAAAEVVEDIKFKLGL